VLQEFNIITHILGIAMEVQDEPMTSTLVTEKASASLIKE
jgi:hypothetical protein